MSAPPDRPLPAAAGFGLVEVLVSLALLSLVTTGVAVALLGSSRASTRQARWVEATWHAWEALEQMRAGQTAELPDVVAATLTVREEPGPLDLRRVEVVVEVPAAPSAMTARLVALLPLPPSTGEGGS